MRCNKRTAAKLLGALVLVLTGGHAAWALDEEHAQQADAAIARGIAYLRGSQAEDGSWSPQAGPAVTAMALRVMLERAEIPQDDPAVVAALKYVLAHRQPDGGIYDTILPNYNTAICLSALSRVEERPDVTAAIAKGQAFLRDLQWHDQKDAAGKTIDESHPFYGGAGYGRNGRPDLSNTQIMLEGLYDSGLECTDPAFVRALVFITRCQGTTANQMFADKIKPDGGFIYATSVNKEQVGVPQSAAGEETVDVAGQPVSRLRTYGSMTYAGFKSYLYAVLDRDDQRVVDAFDWIRHNYTLARNPGMPEAGKHQGYYYYLMTFSRALEAWGVEQIETADGRKHDWANDLIDQLVSMQRADGSWTNATSRWMEADANLTTAYALIALTHTEE
jgi:squalene-hopene/tetraprenyl-beta-curcumene cyclase